jgi:hypothetical protein
MLLRLLSAALVLVGLSLLGVAAWSYFAPPRGPALETPETDMELGQCTPGQETEVVFHLQNNSRRPIRVLGLAPC